MRGSAEQSARQSARLLRFDARADLMIGKPVWEPGGHVLESTRMVRRKRDVRNACPEVIEVHLGTQEETWA